MLSAIINSVFIADPEHGSCTLFFFFYHGEEGVIFLCFGEDGHRLFHAARIHFQDGVRLRTERQKGGIVWLVRI